MWHNKAMRKSAVEVVHMARVREAYKGHQMDNDPLGSVIFIGLSFNGNELLSGLTWLPQVKHSAYTAVWEVATR